MAYCRQKNSKRSNLLSPSTEGLSSCSKQHE
nr:MAG TPA: hypothetical protein [Caudoviricetes sp.]